MQVGGITGDTNEVDDLCAIAGIRAAGFKTDDDFGEDEMRRLGVARKPVIATMNNLVAQFARDRPQNARARAQQVHEGRRLAREVRLVG